MMMLVLEFVDGDTFDTCHTHLGGHIVATVAHAKLCIMIN
jgi:hypothetical protein